MFSPQRRHDSDSNSGDNCIFTGQHAIVFDLEQETSRPSSKTQLRVFLLGHPTAEDQSKSSSNSVVTKCRGKTYAAAPRGTATIEVIWKPAQRADEADAQTRAVSMPVGGTAIHSTAPPRHGPPYQARSSADKRAKFIRRLLIDFARRADLFETRLSWRKSRCDWKPPSPPPDHA